MDDGGTTLFEVFGPNVSLWASQRMVLVHLSNFIESVPHSTPRLIIRNRLGLLFLVFGFGVEEGIDSLNR